MKLSSHQNSQKKNKLNSKLPLHEAVNKNFPNIVKMLLQHGANPNLQERGKQTALHIAASSGSIDTMWILLTKSANIRVNIADPNGYTPLHCISQYAKKDVSVASKGIKMLLEHGADPNSLTNVSKRKPQDLVSEFPELVELFSNKKDSRGNIEKLSSKKSKLESSSNLLEESLDPSEEDSGQTDKTSQSAENKNERVKKPKIMRVDSLNSQKSSNNNLNNSEKEEVLLLRAQVQQMKRMIKNYVKQSTDVREIESLKLRVQFLEIVLSLFVLVLVCSIFFDFLSSPKLK